MKFKNSSFQMNLASLPNNNQTLHDFIKGIDFNSPKLKKIEALLSGIFQSSQYGSGFNFNEIREYKIGDDLRHINWKATAKTNTLHTNEYFAEKESRVFFLVDISSSMFHGNKIKPFIITLAFLFNHINSWSEKCGGIYFNDEIKYNFPQRTVSSQSNIMFQTFFNLLNLNASTLYNPTKTNFSLALDFAKQYFKRKGFIFIVSDLLNVSNWEKKIFELSKLQNIYFFQIYDEIDFHISKSGYIFLIDPESKNKIIVNTDNSKILENYNKLMIEKQNKIDTFLNQIGVKHIKIRKDDFHSLP